MKIFYLANLGTQDLTCDGEISSVTLASGRSVGNCRADGQRWLEQFDSIEASLEAPILLPGFQHMLAKFGEVPPQVHAVLFYTDQDETVKENYRRSDTVNFAHVLQRLLPRRLGNHVHVAIVRVDGNPADHNNTLRFFHRKLGEVEQPAKDDVVYIAPVGGPDASNVGLAINAVRRYRDRCQFIYVMPGPDVQLLNLQDELLGDYARREAEAHLKRRDYAALELTLRQCRLGDPWHQQLCVYAECRTRFDFQGARLALAGARSELQSGEVHARVGQFLGELQPFLNEALPPRSASSSEEWEEWFKLQRELLAELFFNLRRKVLQGEWVDFVSRLFRLQEAVLRLVFETESKHSTYKHKDTEFADFSQVINEDAAFSRWFADQDVRIEEPNSRNMFEALRYWVEKRAKGREYGKLYKAMKVIGDPGLVELRNQSIAAHGFRGVSQADVESKAGMSVEKLLNQLKQAVSDLGGEVDGDPYEAIDGLLRQAFDRVT